MCYNYLKVVDFMKKYYYIVFIIIIIILLTSLILIKNKTHKLTVIMAGDALVTQNTLDDAYDEKTNKYNFKPMFKRIKNYIKKFKYLGFPVYFLPRRFGVYSFVL